MSQIEKLWQGTRTSQSSLFFWWKDVISPLLIVSKGISPHLCRALGALCGRGLIFPHFSPWLAILFSLVYAEVRLVVLLAWSCSPRSQLPTDKPLGGLRTDCSKSCPSAPCLSVLLLYTHGRGDPGSQETQIQWNHKWESCVTKIPPVLMLWWCLASPISNFLFYFSLSGFHNPTPHKCTWRDERKEMQQGRNSFKCQGIFNISRCSVGFLVTGHCKVTS